MSNSRVGPLGYGVPDLDDDGAPIITRSIAVIITDVNDQPRPGLSGLRWSWFDQPSPDLFLEPMAQGADATTNPSTGQFSVVAVESNLAPGANGFLIVLDAAGNEVGGGVVAVT